MEGLSLESPLKGKNDRNTDLFYTLFTNQSNPNRLENLFIFQIDGTPVIKRLIIENQPDGEFYTEDESDVKSATLIALDSTILHESTIHGTLINPLPQYVLSTKRDWECWDTDWVVCTSVGDETACCFDVTSYCHWQDPNDNDPADPYSGGSYGGGASGGGGDNSKGGNNYAD